MTVLYQANKMERIETELRCIYTFNITEAIIWF